MSFDYEALAAAGGIGKGMPAGQMRQRRRSRRSSALRRAYRIVDARDESVCWVTGIVLTAGHGNQRYCREHHHLAGRRVRPEWAHNPDRIITVSAYIHGLITSKWLRVHGDDARLLISFSWNRKFVPVGREPFRLDARGAEVA